MRLLVQCAASSRALAVFLRLFSSIVVLRCQNEGMRTYCALSKNSSSYAKSKAVCRGGKMISSPGMMASSQRTHTTCLVIFTRRRKDNIRIDRIAYTPLNRLNYHSRKKRRLDALISEVARKNRLLQHMVTPTAHQKTNTTWAPSITRITQISYTR